MSLSRKNPKKRGNVKNKKTRGKHTKSRKQMGGENHRDDYNLMHIFGNPNSRYGFSRVSVTTKDVEKFINKYNQENLSKELYTFFTSKKTLTGEGDKNVFIKNKNTERNPDQELPDNIKNKMWTDYINELCKKVEKQLDDNIKEAKKREAKETKTKEEEAKEEEAKEEEAKGEPKKESKGEANKKRENVMKHITLLRRLNTPGIWEYLWMDWFPEAVTDEDDNKKSITYSTTIKQYKDIDALNYGNDGELKLLFPQNSYKISTQYKTPLDKILHMISTFESSMYAQMLSAAAIGQNPNNNDDANKHAYILKQIEDKSEDASNTIISSTQRIPISKNLIHNKPEKKTGLSP